MFNRLNFSLALVFSTYSSKSLSYLIPNSFDLLSISSEVTYL